MNNEDFEILRLFSLGDLETYNLNLNEDLYTINFKDEESWLALRQKGIGGSDIGAIMKLNKYNSPLSIYKQKVLNEYKDMSDNIYVKKGKDLEDFILTKFVIPDMRNNGYSVGKPDFMIVNRNYEYFRANVDGIAYKLGSSYENNIVIEIKWVSSSAEKNWGSSEYCGIPSSYYAQVQLYMLVTGAKEANLYALFDSSWECRKYAIPRDEEFISNMIVMGKEFYYINMETKTPPKAIWALDPAKDALSYLDTELEPVANEELDKHLLEYKEINNKIKDLDAKKFGKSQIIYEMVSAGFVPKDPSLKVKISEVHSVGFEMHKFKKEHPEIFKQYSYNTSYSRLTIK